MGSVSCGWLQADARLSFALERCPTSKPQNMRSRSNPSLLQATGPGNPIICRDRLHATHCNHHRHCQCHCRCHCIARTLLLSLCVPVSLCHGRKLLKYLIPVRLCRGILPAHSLLQQFQLTEVSKRRSPSPERESILECNSTCNVSWRLVASGPARHAHGNSWLVLPSLSALSLPLSPSPPLLLPLTAPLSLAPPLSPFSFSSQYTGIVQAMRSGDVRLLRDTLETYEDRQGSPRQRCPCLLPLALHLMLPPASCFALPSLSVYLLRATSVWSRSKALHRTALYCSLLYCFHASCSVTRCGSHSGS